MVGWLKRLFFQQQEEPVAVTGIKVGDGNVELTVRTNLRKLYNVKVSKRRQDEYEIDSDYYDTVGLIDFVWGHPIEELTEVYCRIQEATKRELALRRKMGKHVSRNKKPDPKYVQEYRSKLSKIEKDRETLERRFDSLSHEIIEEGNNKHTEWDTTERQRR